MRSAGAEAALSGQTPSEGAIAAAGRAAAADCDPSPDLRGSIEYKRDVTRVLTQRAIHKAIERAKGATA